MEREKGIEPSPLAWEASVLPLNYSRRDATKGRIASASRDWQESFLLPLRIEHASENHCVVWIRRRSSETAAKWAQRDNSDSAHRVAVWETGATIHRTMLAIL